MEPRQLPELYRLLNALCENRISSDDFSCLDQWLSSDSQAREIYFDFVNMWSDLQFFQSADMYQDPNLPANISGLPALSHPGFQETIERDLMRSSPNPAEETQADQDHSNHTPVPHRRSLSDIHWPRILLKTAAIILLCLTVLWLDRWIMRESAIQPRRVVAHLIDQMNARWDKSSRLPYDDGRMSQDAYHLTEGYVHIRFECGADVIIEAPAQWSLLTDDNMQLTLGKAYATVPLQALGFAIKAGNAKVIDLGTEFGIEIDDRQMTQLHVMKGKTLLISGLEHGNKAQCEMSQGQARQVDLTGNVQKIELASRLFARRIDSRAHLVWKGQPAIDLADIVARGNGWGTGNKNWLLDPLSGHYTQNWINQTEIKPKVNFRPVPENVLIDSLFIPNPGQQSQVTISTTGLVFQDCPPTANRFNDFIQTCQNPKDRRLHLPARQFDPDNDAIIYLHSNLGITFDLEMLRQQYPGLELGSFQTRCAITSVVESAQKDMGKTYQAVFHVLLDGQSAAAIPIHTRDAPQPLSINLAPEHRFLTLLVTDGGDDVFGDRTFFINPEIVFHVLY